MDLYKDIYEESIKYPEIFWCKQGKLLNWHRPWKNVLDNNKPPFIKWFVGGEINACYNAIDRHVENGKGDKIALIHDSPLTGVKQKLSYRELMQKTSKLAGALSSYGVKKGDVVLIYMPLIPETVIAIMATARLGAVHSVVFGGFAAGEVCLRIQHAKPKIIIAASCGIEPNKIVDFMQILEDALLISSHQPKKCIIYQRKECLKGLLDPKRDILWEDALKNAKEHPCIFIESNEPLYILYTSGTTGNPKGVQRPIGGHLVTLAWTMQYLYNLKKSDVWWTTSDFGWVVGHSYMCYAPLLAGLTSVIYEGKPTITPNPGQYFRIIEEYKVNAMFTVPTAVKLLKEADPNGFYRSKYDISSLRQIWFAGEHCDSTTKKWTEKIFGVGVSNHWWQTETGSGITAMCSGLKNPCEATDLTVGLPVPGYNVKILRKNGEEAEVNKLGRIVVKLPLPPGTLSTLYKAPQRFLETYFCKYPGYYDTMDSGYVDKNGLIYVTARSDDVINVAGHRLSTLAVENVVLSHPDVSNACVVSVPDKIKGEVPFCLFVINKGSSKSEYVINQELVNMVRSLIGPVASFRLCASIRGLPTTISGKICRKSISDLARKKLTKISPTVVDPLIYDDIKIILKRFGFA
ncbi:unnamed protein product [Brassicogethes aeneus]|uniref:Acyl-CoA synthetase short-chain family member 3, mitochondrial n=1 Tax=Brassicogethes aeneus TaxID=1431903 RepID=A0A9P0B4M6_BRAAE|nr:unnamed protein product [Brassicogethes aeneus]